MEREISERIFLIQLASGYLPSMPSCLQLQVQMYDFSPLFTQNISFLAYGINLCHASTLVASCCYFKHWICSALFTIRLLERCTSCDCMNSLLISRKVNVQSSPTLTDGQAKCYKHSTEGEVFMENLWSIGDGGNHVSSFGNIPDDTVTWLHASERGPGSLCLDLLPPSGPTFQEVLLLGVLFKLINPESTSQSPPPSVSAHGALLQSPPDNSRRHWNYSN